MAHLPLSATILDGCGLILLSVASTASPNATGLGSVCASATRCWPRGTDGQYGCLRLETTIAPVPKTLGRVWVGCGQLVSTLLARSHEIRFLRSQWDNSLSRICPNLSQKLL